MTDLEIAEQYANEYATLDLDPTLRVHLYECAKEAYLAGLKAGRPKWHKVADGDLPKDTSVKRVFVGNNEYYQLYYTRGRWVYCDKGGLHFFGDVIAWCEMPTFTDKEGE